MLGAAIVQVVESTATNYLRWSILIIEGFYHQVTRYANKRLAFQIKNIHQHFQNLKHSGIIDESIKRYESARVGAEHKAIARETGCKGNYALRKLPNHDRFLNTPVEPIHLIKNIVEHVVCLLSGLEDSYKVKRGRAQTQTF